jgi:hypothetical protein
MENNKFIIELKQGDYFDYGQHYFVEFKYGDAEQQAKMYELFTNTLIPYYGSKSQRAKNGEEYIMPYFATKDGAFTQNNTGIIGGTSIPEGLLPEFIRRFVEVDKAVVKIGEQQIENNFDYDEFNTMIGISSNKTR